MDTSKLTLQTAFEELEQISDYLNSQDLDLEVALEKFKRGQQLIQYCQSQIKNIENQFIEITQDADTSSSDLSSSNDK